MNKLYSASIAAAFAAASTLAILAGSTQQSATSKPAILSNAPAIALADRDDRGDNNNENSYDNEDNGGQNGCVNPAGNTRGWCKHKGKHGNGNHRGGRGTTTLSGTVLGIQGNAITYRLDNGQVVTIFDNNGTRLNVGQHYNLQVSNQNGQYMLGSSGYYNGNGNNGQYGYGNQSVSGTIGIASGNTLTFTNGRTIDISQVNGNTNGPLSTLRSITAYGYVSNGVFYAQYIR